VTLDGRRVYSAKNALWLLAPDGHIETEIANHGTWESGSIDKVLNFIQPHMTCIDVGANIGWYSILIAQRGARVISFEADQRTVHLLQVNAALNRVRLDIQPVWCGDGAGAMMTIDSLRLLRDCHFIKIDSDGHELHVLKGALETIEMCHPVILFEVCDDCLRTKHGIAKKDYQTGALVHEMFNLLSAYGYKFYWANGMQPVTAQFCIDNMKHGSMDVFACDPGVIGAG
jgi:hypothetical protein